ncbi:MAG: hypothetical protein ACKOE4_02630 [Candidatus Kapaibacterium sp.]
MLRYVLLSLWLFGSVSLQASDTIRVCSYNLLKFSQGNEDGRIPQFKRILDSIRPDIVVCSELADASVRPRFLSQVLTEEPLAATPY